MTEGACRASHPPGVLAASPRESYVSGVSVPLPITHDSHAGAGVEVLLPIEAADVALMRAGIDGVPPVVALARRTMRTSLRLKRFKGA